MKTRGARAGKTVAASGLLDGVLRKHHLFDGVTLSRIRKDRADYLGSYFADKLEPIELEQGRLVLKATTDGVRQIAFEQRQELLARIQEKLPGAVKVLFFV